MRDLLVRRVRVPASQIALAYLRLAVGVVREGNGGQGVL